MKSVGEAMALGRTFSQAFAKALRSRELDKTPRPQERSDAELLDALTTPTADRYETILELFARAATAESAQPGALGTAIEAVRERTSIDPWFLRELAQIAADPESPFEGERSFKSVDTCAAEFPARTPYYYSGWGAPLRGHPEGRKQARGTRGCAGRAPLGCDPGRWPQPHWPGDRV